MLWIKLMKNWVLIRFIIFIIAKVKKIVIAADQMRWLYIKILFKIKKFICKVVVTIKFYSRLYKLNLSGTQSITATKICKQLSCFTKNLSFEQRIQFNFMLLLPLMRYNGHRKLHLAALSDLWTILPIYNNRQHAFIYDLRSDPYLLLMWK